jgi:hypothetical protein
MAKKVVEKKVARKKMVIPTPTRGTGKTHKTKVEDEKPLSKMSDTTKTLLTLIGGGVLGYLMYKLFDKDRIDDRVAREKVFEIITNNCSSMGVNKMQMVNEIAREIKIERKKRKEAEAKVIELESKLLTITEELERLAKYTKKEEVVEQKEEVKA